MRCPPGHPTSSKSRCGKGGWRAVCQRWGRAWGVLATFQCLPPPDTSLAVLTIFPLSFGSQALDAPSDFGGLSSYRGGLISSLGLDLAYEALLTIFLHSFGSQLHPEVDFPGVRTGSWTGPPQGERAPRVEISGRVISEKRCRLRAKREHVKRLYGLIPARQGQNLGLTVFCVPYRGTSLMRNNPPPLGHHKALDIVLR